MAKRITAKLDAQPLARLLAAVMTIADPAGRAKVLEEARRAAGRSFRPKIGLSFADGDADVLAPESLEPSEALEFFRQKIGMTRRAFDKLQARYREVAFTVARIESVALLEQIQGLVDEALATGSTRAEFRRKADEAIKAAGVSPLKPHHLETVFDNAANSAYQTGRMSQMLQADVRRALPFWTYRTVGGSRVRPAHRALHGFTARYDDAAWKRIYPPNGHRCRCSVTAASAKRAKAEARARGVDLETPGLRRLPAQPDEGFESSPAVRFRRELEGGDERLG